MRLTLRTLLSWKDGMLEEAAARDLAAKVEASEAARRLVDRIDEVTGRPTLSAPAPDATGFATSANSTAEYLDNVLSAEQLGAFERVCFASDAQLAETAACHEILAGWSRESVRPLDKVTRRRLLAAVQSRATGGTDGTITAPSEALPRVKPVASAGRPGPQPSTRGRSATTAWLLVAAAVALFACLVGVLGWSLTKRRGKPSAVVARAAEDVGRGAQPAAVEPTAPDAQAGVIQEAAPPAPVVAAVEPPTPPTPAPAPPATAPMEDFPPVRDATEPGPADAPNGEPVAVAPPATPPVSPAIAPPPVPQAERLVPQGAALAIAAPALPAVEQAVQSAAPVAAPAEVPPVDAKAAAVAGPAVLLYRRAGGAAEPWLAGAAATPLDLPVDLLAPPSARPVVVVDGVRMLLEPGTRATLSRDADGAPRLEVVFGAAVVAGARLGVTAGALTGVVTTGAAAPVGVEVRLARPPGAAAEATTRIARVMPSVAPIGWQATVADGAAVTAPLVGVGAAVDIPAGRALEWRSAVPDAATVVAVGTMPPWLAGRQVEDSVDRRSAESLARRLAAGTPAVPALVELTAGRRVEDRVAAAATLALAGEFDAVAGLLAADGTNRLPDGLWTRLDAVAVEPALARGPRAAEALARALAAHAPPGATDAVIRFARGFTDEELAAGGDAELVAALESPHLVVRRYAIKNLVAITGVDAADRLRYRADRQPEMLRDGAAWWRTRLEQGRIRRGAADAGAGRERTP